jgi:hypothetical protein
VKPGRWLPAFQRNVVRQASTLKMEADHSSETDVTVYLPTRRSVLCLPSLNGPHFKPDMRSAYLLLPFRGVPLLHSACINYEPTREAPYGLSECFITHERSRY